MIIFPAMDLWADKVVKLDARYHSTLEKTYGDAREIRQRFEAAGATWLHVIDVGSAVPDGKPGRETAKSLKGKAKIQFGGGLRDEKAILEALEFSDRVIVGTKAIKDPKGFGKLAAKYPKRLVVALDAAGKDVVVEGWQKRAGHTVTELAEVFTGMPIAGFLYTNVAVEGKSRGVDWEPVQYVMRSVQQEIVFAGGVSSLDDVRKFRDLGAYGLVLGSAIYSGKIDLAEAIAETTK